MTTQPRPRLRARHFGLLVGLTAVVHTLIFLALNHHLGFRTSVWEAWLIAGFFGGVVAVTLVGGTLTYIVAGQLDRSGPTMVSESVHYAILTTTVCTALIAGVIMVAFYVYAV